MSSNSFENNPEAAVVAALTKSGLTPSTLSVGESDTSALSFSPETRVVSLERFQARPIRARGTQILTSLLDLVAFLGKQAKEVEGNNTVIFADRDNLKFTAIIDYHHKDEASWMDYRAEVKYKPSRQLEVWKAKHDKRMSQEEFALFLEENIEDIVSPTGAEVLTFAETLEATRTEIFKSSITTATGEMKLQYSSERNGEASSALITDINLGIPLFHGGEAYQVKVKIYHRVTEGRLSFWFQLRHLDHLIDTAWKTDFDYLNVTVGEYASVYQGLPPQESTPLPLA